MQLRLLGDVMVDRPQCWVDRLDLEQARVAAAAVLATLCCDCHYRGNCGAASSSALQYTLHGSNNPWPSSPAPPRLRHSFSTGLAFFLRAVIFSC